MLSGNLDSLMTQQRNLEVLQHARKQFTVAKISSAFHSAKEEFSKLQSLLPFLGATSAPSSKTEQKIAAPNGVLLANE